MENNFEIQNISKILKSNWKTLLGIPLAFLILSLVITFFIMKPKFEASTQVLVNQKEKNSEVMAQEVQSNIQLVNTYAEIIKSPRIIDEVAKKNKQFSASQIKSMLSVTTEPESQVLNISINGKSKKVSENVANDIATVFKEEMPNIMKVDNVSILSKADGTGRQVSPNVSANIIFGILLGFVLAVLIIIIKELTDNRIKTETDVENELGIPVLGSIQKVK